MIRPRNKDVFMDQGINADIVMSRHGETRLNSLMARNHGYSQMKWERSEENKKLTVKGKTQASQLGSYLKRNGWIPDIFLTSTSERSIQTATIAATELDITLSDDNLIKLAILKETSCFEYMDDHIPNHTFGKFPSYNEKILEAKDILAVLWEERFLGRHVLFIGHEMRNTLLLDAALGKRKIMNVPSVCFPNCGIQFLKRGERCQLFDLGGVFHLDRLR